MEKLWSFFLCFLQCRFGERVLKENSANCSVRITEGGRQLLFPEGEGRGFGSGAVADGFFGVGVAGRAGVRLVCDLSAATSHISHLYKKQGLAGRLYAGS